MTIPLRHILVTGASSGIGAALARHYAAPGIRLTLGARDKGRLEATADQCRARGATAAATRLDVTARGAVRDWIEAADATLALDLVIANAGIGSVKESEELARQVFAVNLDGILNTAYPAIDCMVRRGSGQLALMSSLAGYRGLPEAPAYSASKAAVKSLGEAWRGALAAAGIRVSVICPGFIATPMTAGQKFPMPFLMDAERAAGIIARGLARNRARIAFPWPMAFATSLLAAMPAGLADRLMRPRPTRR
jgi:short-subunit dehydrogenase